MERFYIEKKLSKNLKKELNYYEEMYICLKQTF